MKKRKSTLRLPPDRDSLDLKTNRVNYQTYLLMNYDQPCAPPSPLNHGWYIDSRSCRPTRYTRPALPRNLGEVMRRQDTLPDDILNDSGDSDSNDEDTIDNENDDDNDIYDDVV